MPDSFRFHLKAEIQPTVHSPWQPILVERSTTCRELAIGIIRNAFYGARVFNITSTPMRKTSMAVNTDYFWINTEDEVFQEIARATGTKICSGNIMDKFVNASQPVLKITGNDKMILPAFYWVVLAMRRGIQEKTGPFRERMFNTKANDERTWNIGYDRLPSVRAWDRLTQKGQTPSTLEMIACGYGPIQWYGWMRNRQADWHSGLVTPIYAEHVAPQQV